MANKKKNFSGMHTLYRSADILFRADPAGYRSVVAESHIGTGAVLLIEHMFSCEFSPQTWERSYAYLYHNPSYSAELYPRWAGPSEFPGDILMSKLQSNAVMDPYHNKYALWDKGAWFNHSYNYNAVVQFAEPIQVFIENVVYFQYFAYYVAWRPIEPGEEITVLYNDNVPFLDCPRPAAVPIPNYLVFYERFPKTIPFVIQEITRYCRMPEYAENVFVQVAASNGIMFDEVLRQWCTTSFFLENLSACYPGWTSSQWLEFYRTIVYSLI